MRLEALLTIVIFLVFWQISRLSKNVNNCSWYDYCKNDEACDSCGVVRHQASTSVLLTEVSLGSSVVTSADLSLLYEQPPALATLAKAARTMIAIMTVPPKKAIFGWRFMCDWLKSLQTLMAQPRNRWSSLGHNNTFIRKAYSPELFLGHLTVSIQKFGVSGLETCAVIQRACFRSKRWAHHHESL